jgi:hypothetical protein
VSRMDFFSQPNDDIMIGHTYGSLSQSAPFSQRTVQSRFVRTSPVQP